MVCWYSGVLKETFYCNPTIVDGYRSPPCNVSYFSTYIATNQKGRVEPFGGVVRLYHIVNKNE